MVYNEYTTTASRVFFVMYRCSQCKAINATTQIASAKRVYNDKGTFTKKGLEKRKTAAVEGSTEDLNQLMQKIYEEARHKRYNSANLNCQCQKCGHREPWAKIHFTTLRAIMKFTAILAFLGAVIFFGLLCGNNSPDVLRTVFPYSLLAVLSWLAPACYILVVRSINNKKIDNMSRANLPCFAVTKERANEILAQMQATWNAQDQT